MRWKWLDLQPIWKAPSSNMSYIGIVFIINLIMLWCYHCIWQLIECQQRSPFFVQPANYASSSTLHKLPFYESRSIMFTILWFIAAKHSTYISHYFTVIPLEITQTLVQYSISLHIAWCCSACSIHQVCWQHGSTWNQNGYPGALFLFHHDLLCDLG